jgi:hypothetical protein
MPTVNDSPRSSEGDFASVARTSEDPLIPLRTFVIILVAVLCGVASGLRCK